MFKMESFQMHNESITLPIKTEPSANDSVVSISRPEWSIFYQDVRPTPYSPPPLHNSYSGERQTRPQHWQNVHLRQMNHYQPPWPYRHPYHRCVQQPLYPPMVHNYARHPAWPYPHPPIMYRMLTNVSSFQKLPIRLCQDVNDQQHSITNTSKMNVKPMIDVDQRRLAMVANDEKTIEIGVNTSISTSDVVAGTSGDDSVKMETKPIGRLGNSVRNRHYTFDSLKIGTFRFRTFIKPNKNTKVRLLFNLRVLVYDFRYRYKLLESNDKLPILVLIIVPLDSIVNVDVRDTSVTIHLREPAKIVTAFDRYGSSDKTKKKLLDGQNTIDITNGQVGTSLEHTFTLLRPFGEILKKCLTEYNPNVKIRISNEKIVRRIYKLRIIRGSDAQRIPRAETRNISQVQSNGTCSVISAITKCDDEPAERQQDFVEQQQESSEPPQSTSSDVHSVDSLPDAMKIKYPNLVHLSDDEDEFVVVDH